MESEIAEQRATGRRHERNGTTGSRRHETALFELRCIHTNKVTSMRGITVAALPTTEPPVNDASRNKVDSPPRVSEQKGRPEMPSITGDPQGGDELRVAYYNW